MSPLCKSRKEWCVANMVHMAFSTNSMTPSKNLKPSLGRSLSDHTLENFDFSGAKNFLKVFLPFRFVGFCLWACPSGRGL